MRGADVEDRSGVVGKLARISHQDSEFVVQAGKAGRVIVHGEFRPDDDPIHGNHAVVGKIGNQTAHGEPPVFQYILNI